MVLVAVVALIFLCCCCGLGWVDGFVVPRLAGSPVNTGLFSATEGGASTTTASCPKAPQPEIDRRRNLAIISHPDSGKTTMTEKLLLYGGAIQQAGAVRQKAEQRSTASDFMEMEKERGISISSTVMNFDYNGLRVNILDTPGHQDFSEDTYRALAAGMCVCVCVYQRERIWVVCFSYTHILSVSFFLLSGQCGHVVGWGQGFGTADAQTL